MSKDWLRDSKYQRRQAERAHILQQKRDTVKGHNSPTYDAQALKGKYR